MVQEVNCLLVDSQEFHYNARRRTTRIHTLDHTLSVHAYEHLESLQILHISVAFAYRSASVRASTREMSSIERLCLQRIMQARTKCRQHSRCWLGSIPKSAGMEKTVIQFFNWSAVKLTWYSTHVRWYCKTIHTLLYLLKL